MKRHHTQSGFTLIEVMVTLVVFMIAVMGLVALQSASMNGTHFGKRHTAAVNVAAAFVTQLQNEISHWAEQNPTPFPVTRYPMLTTAFAAQDTWHELDATLQMRVGEYLGHSVLDANTGQYRFCVNYMLSPFEDRQVDEDDNSAIRTWQIRVRTSWTKTAQFDGSNWTNCAPNFVNNRIVNLNIDHAVELVSYGSREFSIGRRKSY